MLIEMFLCFNFLRNAKNFWGDSLKEYYCVDTSSTMNELAKLLLQEGNPNNEKILPKGLFYRQFLPASQNVCTIKILMLLLRTYTWDLLA